MFTHIASTVYVVVKIEEPGVSKLLTGGEHVIKFDGLIAMSPLAAHVQAVKVIPVLSANSTQQHCSGSQHRPQKF